MRTRCNSCGGIYGDDTQPASRGYWHACPDQIVDVAETTDKDGKILTPAKFKPTPNPRNENLVPDPDNPGKHRMVSEGSGVTEVE